MSLKVTMVSADIGVGIMPGKITVNESLMPGGQYQLTSIQVVNTGTETAQYKMDVAQMGKQDELQPSNEFFSFNPESFKLEAEANQVISVSLNIPLGAEPGDYLAYVEAHPVSQNTGGTSIGVAAATKVYFTVKPASTWAGIMNMIGSFFKRNAPISYIVPGVIVVGILIFLVSRRLKLELRVSRK
jgi:hypothetical protein